MRFYTQQHQCSGGIDLHARTMYGCILSQDGESRRHRDMNAGPETFLKTIAPDRDDIVVAVEGRLTWYWLADLCAQAGLPFVLGHALYMNAMHGGKAQHDKRDAHNIAVRRRGGRLPPAEVDPAAMRAPRALLRRRRSLLHKRAELLPHGQPTNWQDNRPALGKQLADKANRTGVAARFPDPPVQQSLAVAFALSADDDRGLRALAWSITHPAKPHDAKTVSLLQTVPGLGKILRLVWLDASHEIPRFPRGQAFVSSGRRVTCARASAGQRDGTAGTTLGTAYLQGAFSAAAVLFLREHPPGPNDLARVETTHGRGNAWTVLAHKLARAVYPMLHRGTAVDLDPLLQ